MAREKIDLTGNVIVADNFEPSDGAGSLVLNTTLVSAGSAITIPAGSTLAQALQIIINAVNPGV